MQFLDILVVFRLDIENVFATRQLTPLATSITFYNILAHACAEIKILRFWTSLGFPIFDIFFFTFPFSPFLFFLLQCLTFYWARLQLKKLRAIFSVEQPVVVAGNFTLSFSLNFFSIFVHISSSNWPITVIWASLERSFPPAEVEYRWCQFWSKVMTSEMEERPRLVMAGYGWHRSQWVKVLNSHWTFFHMS